MNEILTPLRSYFSSVCKFSLKAIDKSLKLLKLSCGNMFFFVKAMILPLRVVPQPLMRKHGGIFRSDQPFETNIINIKTFIHISIIDLQHQARYHFYSERKYSLSLSPSKVKIYFLCYSFFKLLCNLGIEASLNTLPFFRVL